MSQSAHGFWHVTYASDDRDIDLGVHEGYLDEIALKLGNHGYYLTFERVNPKILDARQPTNTEVTVRLRFGTSSDQLELQNILIGRPAVVINGSMVCGLNSPKLNAHYEAEAMRQRALSKLTSEDKEILGLK